MFEPLDFLYHRIHEKMLTKKYYQVFLGEDRMYKKAQIGDLLKHVYDLWDLEVFSREVKRRRWLNRCITNSTD